MSDGTGGKLRRIMNAKQLAAESAMSEINSGMIVGLGTGSTAEYFIKSLGQALASKKLTGIRGVPTSRASEKLATELGIPLITLSGDLKTDVTVDGADEFDPAMDVIKGLGGALLREKIVAQNSWKLVLVVDDSKRVPYLGAKSPLPVEVTIFGHELQPAFFACLGGTPVLRKAADGSPYLTDNGNYIYDCRFARIDDAPALERRLKQRAGIVETGLFIGLAQRIIVAGSDGKVSSHSRA